MSLARHSCLCTRSLGSAPAKPPSIPKSLAAGQRLEYDTLGQAVAILRGVPVAKTHIAETLATGVETSPEASHESPVQSTQCLARKHGSQ